MTTFKFSNEDQTLTIYNLSSDTNELIGMGDCFVPANTGLPAHCTNIKPPKAKVGFALVFDEVSSSWVHMEDHRGETVYDTDSMDSIFISSLGALPEHTTPATPPGEHYKWNGSSWVRDPEAERAASIDEANQQKELLLLAAKETISLWQSELALGIIGNDDKKRLIEWIAYIKLLKEVDISMYPNIRWPEPPNC
ncbi:tail fiber assembly protein [Escherichia coli]|uniref:tail fiber assembly protein n=1 Tax=Escherichia coli TaxID=562 RepID=UPI000CE68DDD|nr:tail fiber assembly protein [Escherichia coli]PPE50863.1 phage tail protein [Escherichia coli]